MTKPQITIDGRKIGESHPPYVIAELSGNHNGSLGHALKLMESACTAGANAIKLQTYTPDTMTIDHDSPDFLINGGLWDGRSLYELFQEAYTPWEWHETLFAKGKELGITVFSTPFDDTSVDFLESLNAPAYKIASFEAIDIPLIEKVAQTGKPMIISTGMADLEEIKECVAAAQSGKSNELVLLHCVSGYPTLPQSSNLRTIQDLAHRFDVVTGLSDHTLTTATSIAAIALGAAVIEKHMTLRRVDGGPDAAFSLEPDELKKLTEGCKVAWEALGVAGYEQKACEKQNFTFRRSLYAVSDIKMGDVLTAENVRAIRPGHGLKPKHLPKIIGNCAKVNIKRGTPIQWDLVI